jgi:hypothetical protein
MWEFSEQKKKIMELLTKCAIKNWCAEDELKLNEVELINMSGIATVADTKSPAYFVHYTYIEFLRAKTIVETLIIEMNGFENYIWMGSSRDSSGIFALSRRDEKQPENISHELLIKKLEIIGIQGPILKFIKNYLCDQKFVVKLNGETGETFNVKAGVPQGLVLGPKLFLIYILDLLQALPNCKIFIFADDIVILFAHKLIEACSMVLQKELNSINEWCHDNKICVNMKKTVCMLFCAKAMRGNNKLSIIFHSNDCLHHNFETGCKCEFIEQVDNHVYLGLHVDNELSWKKHIDQVASKLKSALRELNFVQSNVNHNARRILYHA